MSRGVCDGNGADDRGGLRQAPFCFEDSPSPPRPVQLHHSHPTPKTKEQTRSKGAYFCVHMPVFAVVLGLLYFSSSLDSTNDHIVSNRETHYIIHRLNKACRLKKDLQNMYFKV